VYTKPSHRGAKLATPVRTTKNLTAKNDKQNHLILFYRYKTTVTYLQRLPHSP
jgi:hypothetical protein